MDVKSPIPGTLSWSKDDLWAVLLYCQWCLSVRDRKKEIETGDGQMNRTRESGSRPLDPYGGTLGFFLQKNNLFSFPKPNKQSLLHCGHIFYIGGDTKTFLHHLLNKLFL